MYTIGELSKIVKISANALRYYHEIGLLEPMVTLRKITMRNL